MHNLQIVSNSAEETLKIGNNFAKILSKGDIIILSGELGAGKTKFVEGFLSYFNLNDEISSPTFNIVNEYVSININIYHFDLYRLESIDDFYAIGGEEYFDKGICLIEWGEFIESILPSDYIKISINTDYYNKDKRIFDISIPDKFVKGDILKGGFFIEDFKY